MYTESLDAAMLAWSRARAGVVGEVEHATPKRRRLAPALELTPVIRAAPQPPAAPYTPSPSSSPPPSASAYSPTSSEGGPPTYTPPSHAWRQPGPLMKCPFSATSPCCAKKLPCYAYFEDLNELKAWRNDYLFNEKESREETRQRLHAHRGKMKVPGPKGKPSKSYCVSFLKWWSGWGAALLYERRARCSLKRKCGPRSTKDVTVMAWFGILKGHLEMMPDTPTYQVVFFNISFF